MIMSFKNIHIDLQEREDRKLYYYGLLSIDLDDSLLELEEKYCKLLIDSQKELKKKNEEIKYLEAVIDVFTIK